MLDPSDLLHGSPECTPSETSGLFSQDMSTGTSIPSAANQEKTVASQLDLKQRSSKVHGLDIHSCLQFLLELYGTLLSVNNKTPLMQLNETVKSVNPFPSPFPLHSLNFLLSKHLLLAYLMLLFISI